ncbi:ribosome silencing factor [Rhodocista pekingensis]|uniref:Ribosomal silencing factor RsfS n=1 Tax=Rhodocista pekingensis TaxID=201185 RepID=A0ABW2KU38_9PROT
MGHEVKTIPAAPSIGVAGASAASADIPVRIRDLVLQSLDGDKAEDTVVIDLIGKTSLADYMVVTSGRSARQVGAMADHLLEKLKAMGIDAEAEGMPQNDWVLLDAGDVIVHLFRPEVRAFYNIEKMWGVEPPASLIPTGFQPDLRAG